MLGLGAGAGTAAAAVVLATMALFGFGLYRLWQERPFAVLLFLLPGVRHHRRGPVGQEPTDPRFFSR